MNLYAENDIISIKDLFDILNNLCDLNRESFEISIHKIKNQEKFDNWKSKWLKIDAIHDFKLKGIDIPFWKLPNVNSCELKKYENRILILGQEPLRTITSFNCNGLDIFEDIEVSTPFGIHLENDNRLKSRLGTYWNIINMLASSHFIYTTDFSKIWFQGFEREIQPLDKLNKTNRLMWGMEYTKIKPDVIITFGNSWKHLLPNPLSIVHEPIPIGGYEYSLDGVTSKIIPLLHPSWNASKHRKTFFETNNIFEGTNTIDKYQKLLNKHLSP